MRITRSRALLASLAVHGCVVALAAAWLPKSGNQEAGPSCDLCVALQIPDTAGGLLAEEPADEPAEETSPTLPPEPTPVPETQPTIIATPPLIAQNLPLPPPIARSIPMNVPAAIASPNKANRSRSNKTAATGELGSAEKSGGKRGGGAGVVAATPPRLLRKVRPQYPETARSSGWEGTVALTLSVDTQGRVARVRVQQSSGHETLDSAAVAAARSYEFSPALSSGQPIPWTFEHRIVFTRR